LEKVPGRKRRGQGVRKRSGVIGRNGGKRERNFTLVQIGFLNIRVPDKKKTRRIMLKKIS
jgi:hypothetical protein